MAQARFGVERDAVLGPRVTGGSLARNSGGLVHG